MSKRDFKKAVKKHAEATAGSKIQFSEGEIAIYGLPGNDGEQTAHVNMKYYCPEHECLSCWDTEQLKAFSAFCIKIAATTWSEIYKSAGAPGRKAGFGYTPHKNRSVLPNNAKLDKLGPDLTWFELRVTGEARVHGFRCRDAFFAVYLDRQHQIYPG